VDGVFDKDPNKHADAKLYRNLRYIEVLEQNLKVMDSAAISLCMDNELPIIVFNLTQDGNIKKVVEGQNTGTVVSTQS
jgi:uridylate kinase